MAPKKSTKASAAPANSQSDSQDASQDSGQQARTFEKRLKDKTTERRETKTARIQAAHNDRMTKLRTDVNKCFEDHDRELRGLRRPNVERLMKLVQRKRELEVRIDKCQTELARSFEEASQQLQASVDGRVEDLSV